MSDISMSADTMSSIATESLASGAEFVSETSNTIASGASDEGSNDMVQAVIGAEVVSPTDDYIGTGTDFSSTGTDVNIQNAIQTTLMSGMGSIADKIA